MGNLLGIAVNSVEKAINSVKDYLRHLKPKISLGTQHAHLEFTVDRKGNAAVNIEEALNLIEKILAEKKQRAIMLFDEFQTVGLIAKGSGVEAAIRNAIQDMKYLSIIFSGSNRRLLQSMFEDKNRPLYKLCRKLYLERIEAKHYQKHLNKAAQAAWESDLTGEVFDYIMQLTERHPYYVNYLCDIVWTNNISLPQVKNVTKAWDALIEEERSDINAEIAQLSMGQRRVLKYIAHHPSESIMSVKAVQSIGVALSSISGAILALSEKDVIEKQNKHYCIINPAIRYVLSEGRV